MVTFTMPPPDSPLTSIVAISAWTFCMLACMAWACFIMLPKLPRMFWALLTIEIKLLYGTNSVGQQRSAEALAQPLDAGIGLERAARGIEILHRGALLSLR